MRMIGRLFRFTTGLVIGTCVGAAGMLVLVCEYEANKDQLDKELAAAKKRELAEAKKPVAKKPAAKKAPAKKASAKKAASKKA